MTNEAKHTPGPSMEIVAIEAHLFNKRTDPYVWIRRGDKGRFYSLTHASYYRLWLTLVGRGRVSITQGGWLWLR